MQHGKRMGRGIRVAVGARMGIVLGLSAALLGSMPAPAQAGGFEFPAAGTRPLGRGGAFYARADSPLALLYNPANLASLRGAQAGLDLHVAFFDACFDRSGTYAENAGADSGTRFGSSSTPPPGGYDGVPHPKVCNQAGPGYIPELAASYRIHEDVGLGFGIVAPAGVGNTKWGNADRGTVDVPTSVHPEGELPSPARYNLVEENLLIFYPSVGLGYSPHPMVRLGASFGWGIGLFDFTNYTVPFASEAFSTDIRTRIQAEDLFVPRLNVSAHVIPHENVDVMLGFIWNDDVEADGTLELTSGAYRDEPVQERVSRCSGTPYSPDEQCVAPIDGMTLDAPMPWKLSFGIRYADRIRPRDAGGDPTEVGAPQHDPMTDERWDVELDVVYEMNSRVDKFVVEVPEGEQVVADEGLPAPLPERNVIPHQWKDQVSVRLGGDYNIIPGRLAARAGFSFESRGVKDAYPQLDFMPFRRYGLHAGFTVRVKRFDISVAYAHLFQETTEVTENEVDPGRVERENGERVVVGQKGVPQVAATLTGGQPPYIVNKGKINSDFDVLSVSVKYAF
jgi:long-chain fatty acid transport protein